MSFQRKLFTGLATSNGTKQFMEFAINKGTNALHFKKIEDLYLSSLGMGTYLGNLSDQDNKDIENALYYSIKEGCINVIDTAINYRSMLSEKSIGKALTRLFEDQIISRNNVFICTKNGYVTNDGDLHNIDIDTYLKLMFLDNETISRSDISPSYHIMNPNYISKCIDKSLCNMGISSIDLVYLHNSFESWFNYVEKSNYIEMLSKVFQVYEDYREKGKINFYGLATWNCFTSKRNSPSYLSLEDIVHLANDIGGSKNGFKFIQLPYNARLTEAFTLKNQKFETLENLSIIESAQNYGIHVFTSVPFYQGKLLNADLDERVLENLTTNSSKLLQFVRSTPGIVAPLVGQKKMEHVKENVLISKYPILDPEQFYSLIKHLREINQL